MDMVINNKPYPSVINKHWKTLLLNQFHDIIPGSSIKEVYDGTDKDYAEIHGTLDRIFEDKHDNSLECDCLEGKLFAVGLETFTVGSQGAPICCCIGSTTFSGGGIRTILQSCVFLL